MGSLVGLNITALGVSYNERGYNDNFMKSIRKALNAAVATTLFESTIGFQQRCSLILMLDLSKQGLAHVKTIGGDQCGENTWKIVGDMQKDKDLQDAIDIIGELFGCCRVRCSQPSGNSVGWVSGVHNPGPISEAASIPAGTLKLGKPIWGT